MESRGFCLLIADDEEDILFGMENFISKHTKNFSKIYCARDGQEALDYIIRYHPDVMLIDVKMPVKSGLEVMKNAREMGLLPKTIILSGYDTFTYAQQAIRVGAMDYLLKPCSSTEILQKLEGLVDTDMHRDETETGNLLIARAQEHIRAHMDEELSLSAVANVVGLTTNYFSSLFNQNVGCGFVDYLNLVRIEAACGYMYNEKLKLYEIGYRVGYQDPKYFYKVFKKVTGKRPSEYRKSICGFSDDSTGG